MNLTDAELAALNATMSEAEWNAVCDAIKAARDGKYPPDWAKRVLAARVLTDARKRWAGEEPSLAARVNATFMACLFQDGEPKENAVLVRGVIHRFGFHPGRIAEHKEAIRGYLNLMPLEFHSTATGGKGGWSFLNLCAGRDGEQWAEHPTMEMLVGLAIASGLGQHCAPEELWPALPGGMPYVVFDTVTGFSS